MFHFIDAAYTINIHVSPSSTYTFGELWLKISTSQYKLTSMPTAIISGKTFKFSVHVPNPISTIDQVLLKYNERDLYSNDHIKVNKVTITSNNSTSKTFCGNSVSSLPKELYHGQWTLFEEC